LSVVTTVVQIVRVLMGVIKARHGTYCARNAVPDKPKGLQAAVARVLENGKDGTGAFALNRRLEANTKPCYESRATACK
jgi:hypothetical protein